MKTILSILAAVLAVFTNIMAQTAITVKPVVTSGPLSTVSGALPGDFTGLDDVDAYTPSQATAIQRLFFGIEVVFPSETSLNLSEIQWMLMRNNNTTPWKTGGVAIWSAPTASSSPYMVAYNNAGGQVSINNSTATGTTVSGVKRLLIGNHKWTLGTNAPAQQPMLVHTLDRYCMGYRIVGTADGVPFAVIPPSANRPSNVAEDRIFGGYATVGVVTPMSKAEWLTQLKFGNPVTADDGVITVKVQDPSGVSHYPSGYYLMGLNWSTDLQTWFPRDHVDAPRQESNLMMGGGGIQYYFTPETRRPHLFFRGSSDDVVTHTEISWWPVDPS